MLLFALFADNFRRCGGETTQPFGMCVQRHGHSANATNHISIYSIILLEWTVSKAIVYSHLLVDLSVAILRDLSLSMDYKGF